MWAKELPGRMLKLPIRVLGCWDRLEIHCRDFPVILEQVRWGAGSTCSRFCGRVIIFLNHHIAIKPISPETVAKHCFAPGNEEKEIPGRPGFDIISRWNIGRVAWIGIPVRSVESADCRPGTKCRPGAKCRLRVKTVFPSLRDYMSFYNLPSVTQSLFLGYLQRKFAYFFIDSFLLFSKHQDHVSSWIESEAFIVFTHRTRGQ